jgi:hypothetical protein
MNEELRVAGRKIRKARDNLDAAMDDGRVLAIKAIANVEAEVDVAWELGVNRLTVRRWLGK